MSALLLILLTLLGVGLGSIIGGLLVIGLGLRG